MPRAPDDSTSKLRGDVGGYELLVAGDGRSSRLALPEEGELLIGRGADADVRLSGDGVSRRHARLRVQGSEFALEDLGSENGTIVRGELAPREQEIPIRPGEALLVGEYSLVLRAVRSRATTRRVWSAEYVEARIAEQCERARRAESARFTLAAVRLEAKCRVDPTSIIAAELRASDVIGRSASDEWTILLLDASNEEAERLAERLEQNLADAGVQARVAVVAYPKDGTSASALMASLSEALDPDPERTRAGSVVLQSPPMLALYDQLDALAKAKINVLILGETGVGKDVLAQRLHERSERSEGPFLRLNCAALVESLVESELFGHEKGSFTGAAQSQPGLLRGASGGTVFLDEVGELPERLQAKLLQVIENKEVLGVGSLRPVPIDVRFVAATNRDLEAEALAGHFRRDLYYRIAGFTLVIPPLRERREDILPLAQAFLQRESARRKLPGLVRIRDDAAVYLLDYAWPGNVRELSNVIERALILSEGKSIGPEHLPLQKMASVVLVEPPASLSRQDPNADVLAADLAGDLSADELEERQRIVDALARSAGNQSKAAELLGVSRSTLLNRLSAYRIQRPRKRSR